MPSIMTTLGELTSDQLGRVLPHEHLFVDLRTWDQPGYGIADPGEVVSVMSPFVEAIQAQDVTLLVEPGSIGVGRRADILRAISEATRLPVVVPTGVYREPWLPPWIRDATETSLTEMFVAELNDQIEETGVRAGWIKVGSTDEGVTDAEAKVLRAATAASLATGVVIGSHTARGAIARDQVDIIESCNGRADRFIWIHTQNEPDLAIHRELAARGIWLEYDGIGDPEKDDFFLDLTMMALDAGFSRSILLSQDRGWFDPAQPRGGTPKPFTHLYETFIPKLRDRGVDDATIHLLTVENPFRGFSR